LLFFCILNIVFICALILNVPDFSKDFPNFYLIYGILIVSFGFLLSIIQSPTYILSFLFGIVLVIIAFNIILEYQNIRYAQSTLAYLSLVNLVYYLVLILTTFQLTFIFLWIAAQINVIYIYYIIIYYLDNNKLKKQEVVFFTLFVLIGYSFILIRTLFYIVDQISKCLSWICEGCGKCCDQCCSCRNCNCNNLSLRCDPSTSDLCLNLCCCLCRVVLEGACK